MGRQRARSRSAVAHQGGSSIDALLRSAVQHHQQGQLERAEALYREVARQRPGQPDALHLLGVIAHQRGESEAAIGLIRRAIAVAPRQAEFHLNLGNALAACGQRDAARAAYERALALKPDLPNGHFNLGNLLLEAGASEAAAAAFRRALLLAPDHPAALNNLGNALRSLGRLVEAADCYRRAATLEPLAADWQANLGNVLHELGHPAEALLCYRRALALAPEEAETLSSLGVVLGELGQTAEGLATLERAAALAPGLAAAHSNLGNARREAGDLARAEQSCRRALELQPDLIEGHANLAATLLQLGQVGAALEAAERALALDAGWPAALTTRGAALQQLGRPDEAIAAYRGALAARPSFVEAHFGLAVALLRSGEYESGLAEYEWRWRRPEFLAARRELPAPEWDGGPLEGRRLLVYAEQGLGDSIQFARYLPLLAERGAEVIFECQPELRRLLDGQGLGARLVTRGERLPAFDLHLPLLSAPQRLGTRLESIPAPLAYLRPDSALASDWRGRLAGRPRPKVGLVWAGNPNNRTDRERSAPLAELEPLSRIAGLHWINLQKGPAAAQMAESARHFELWDPTAALADFADTAALVANLDLVITVDTSVAHLAGALGRPVWLLLAAVADWRWLRDRTTSPWYPSARLFRQPKPADWRALAEQVGEALATWTGSYPASGAST